MHTLTTGAADVVDVILKDGSTLRLRPAAREDADALLACFSNLSEHSFYLRFHGTRRVETELAEAFLERFRMSDRRVNLSCQPLDLLG